MPEASWELPSFSLHAGGIGSWPPELRDMGDTRLESDLRGQRTPRSRRRRSPRESGEAT